MGEPWFPQSPLLIILPLNAFYKEGGFGGTHGSPNNLLYKKSLGCDEAKAKGWLLTLRWCRLIFGNEQNPSNDGEDANAKMNGILLKSLASGGDPQIVRALYQEAISFIFGGRPFICVNEIPQIVPNDACETMSLFTLTNKFVDSLDGLSQAESKFMKLKDPELKNEIRRPDFSNALIYLVLEYYQNKKVVDCDLVKQKTIDHRVDQGDDYLFFKTNFDVTNNNGDKISTIEMIEFMTFKKTKISDKRIKQILVDQYGLKQDSHIIYKEKRGRGYMGLKIKEEFKKEFELYDYKL